jgi:hypothetical protein
VSSDLHSRLLAQIDAMVWPDEDWLPPAFKGGPAEQLGVKDEERIEEEERRA